MAATFLAWLYITAVCWGWGNLVITYLQRGSANKIHFHLTVVCMAGLSVIAIICGYLSLFIPLGGIWPHLVLAPVALFNIRLYLKQYSLISFVKETFSKAHIAVLLLLSACVLLLLVMSTWYITHPDTTGYHAQIVQWIEKYKAVPGLVHLNRRYGLQSSWFTLCAVFSFRFLQSTGSTFMNTTILLWFFYFVMHKLNASALTPGKKKGTALLWLLLLVISITSYTQVRLTATSESPDFIAVIYIWLVCYLFCNIVKSPVVDKIIFLLAFVAVTIKLSALPILLFSSVVLFRYFLLKKWWQLLLFVFIGGFVLIPFISRNIITSGYPAFPSGIGNVAQVDWKYDKAEAAEMTNYIKAYARINTITTKEQIDAVAAMTVSEWLPFWWEQNGLIEKIVLTGVVSSAVLVLFFFKTALWHSKLETRIAGIILAIGILFWFDTAPAIRFGAGFLIAFTGLILYGVFKNIFKNPYMRQGYFWAAMVCTALFIFSYDLYRFAMFFKPVQFIAPVGIAPVSYQIINCKGVLFHIPETDADCGSTPVPCAASCQDFVLRGSVITDGFKSKNK